MFLSSSPEKLNRDALVKLSVAFVYNMFSTCYVVLYLLLSEEKSRVGGGDSGGENIGVGACDRVEWRSRAEVKQGRDEIRVEHTKS